MSTLEKRREQWRRAERRRRQANGEALRIKYRERWATGDGDKAKERRALNRAGLREISTRSGVVIPAERVPEYQHLLEVKRCSAKEALRIMGLSSPADTRKARRDIRPAIRGIWDGLTLEAIAHEEDVSPQAIQERLRRRGLNVALIREARHLSPSNREIYLEAVCDARLPHHEALSLTLA